MIPALPSASNLDLGAPGNIVDVALVAALGPITTAARLPRNRQKAS